MHNLTFERFHVQSCPVIYLTLDIECKPWSLEINLQVEAATSCPFPGTPIIRFNQVRDSCVVPGPGFISLISMNEVFPFCFYLLTAENMSTVHSHNEWGGKSILWGPWLFGLSWDILDIYGFFPSVQLQQTVKRWGHKSENMFYKVHICICYL